MERLLRKILTIKNLFTFILKNNIYFKFIFYDTTYLILFLGTLILFLLVFYHLIFFNSEELVQFYLNAL